MTDCHRPRCREEFNAVIICALPVEYDALVLAFDEFWDEDGDTYGRAIGDQNTYTSGRIGKYNAVLALLPNMGKASAASAIASLRASYTRLQLTILAGICGGVPITTEEAEVVLGDIVIGKGIIQYDLGRQYPQRFLVRHDTGDIFGRPSKDIRSLLATFETEHGLARLQKRTAEFLSRIQADAVAKGRGSQYDHPGVREDRLFAADYAHKHRGQLNCDCSELATACEVALASSCEQLGCEAGFLIPRRRLKGKQQEREPKDVFAGQPRIFVGNFGSGDTVMKSGEQRDRIAKQYGLLAFEMEGAGIWNDDPCLVVKSVCDYADSHKNKNWQRFAAVSAASAVKAVLASSIRTDTPVYESSTRHLPAGLEDSLMSRPSLSYLNPHVTDSSPRFEEVILQAMTDEFTSPSHICIRPPSGSFSRTQTASSANTASDLLEANLLQRHRVEERGLQGAIVLYACVTGLYQLIISLAAILTLDTSVPRTVSLLLSDNVLLYDALGREFSLNISLFRDWPVLLEMLKSQFVECPGLEKVKSGHFIITDVSQPQLVVGRRTWSSQNLRRKKFKMSMVMFHLVMGDGICAKCNYIVRNLSDTSFTCPKCGLFQQSISHSRNKFPRPKLLTEQRQLSHFARRNQHLRVPGHADHNLTFSADMRRYRLEELFRKNICFRPSESLPNDGIGQTASRVVYSEVADHVNHRRPMDQNEQIPGSTNPSAEQIETPEEEEIFPQPSDVTDVGNQRVVELEEIRHFTGISLRHDTALHDAALAGNILEVRHLLRSGVRPDQHVGYWGVPLAAAIFSHSDEAAAELLSAGANVLSRIGPLNGPIQAAATFGSQLSFCKTLEAATESREETPKNAMDFQEAVDNALFSVVDAGLGDRVNTLLHVGANPFRSSVRPPLTAFSLAVAGGKLELVDRFLAEVWYRDLLSSSEVKSMSATLRGENVNIEKLSGWLQATCRNLQIKRTEMVEKKVARQLGRRLFWTIEPPAARLLNSDPEVNFASKITEEADSSIPCPLEFTITSY